jgi:serine/threonine-protein kinase
MGDLAAPGDGMGTARFIVMELLEGETLEERREARGRISPEEIAALACQVLAGLGAAHAAEIVHRDLKPANVFLVRGRSGGDFVKILDFGVSKFNAVSDALGQTAPGATLGTPYYMSPEQAKGAQRIDPRSDLYSVGVMLYECVTGQVPFDAGTFNELIFRIVLEAPPPMESFVPDVDPGFIAIVRKAMAREPGDRYQSAREMHDALAQWLAQVTGQTVSPGVVPWEGGAPFVPTASSARPAVGPGPGTEFGLEHAQTRLFVPKKRISREIVATGIGLLVVLLGALLLVALRRDPERPVPTVALGASATATALPGPSAAAVAPAGPSAEPAALASAAPVLSAAPTVARPGTPAPKKTGTATPAPAPGGRTVPSEL